MDTHSQILKRLTQMVESKPQTADKDRTKSLLFSLEKEMKGAGFQTKIYEKNGYFSLLCAINLKKEYQYLLLGHVDVVPAPDASFKLVEKNGELHGRGTIDMNGENAVMIQVMIDLLKENQLKDTALLLTSDEEIGGMNGTRYMVEEEGIRAGCAFVPDGGFYNQLCIGEKGILHVKVTANGIGAHGSRPWLGENAIEKLIHVFNEIKKTFENTTLDDNWKRTVNLGKLSGGVATNSVATGAEMYLDFRYPRVAEREEIIEIVKNATGLYKASYEVLAEGLPTEMQPDNEYILQYKKVAKNHNIEMDTCVSHGGSDARFFTPYNTALIMTRPKGSDAHADDEYVERESLLLFYTMLKEFLS